MTTPTPAGRPFTTALPGDLGPMTLTLEAVSESKTATVALKTIGHCAACRHWVKGYGPAPNALQDVAFKVGECLMAAEDADSCIWIEEADGSVSTAVLVTHEHFGCVQWEAQE